jgi:hypothetical protein
LIHGKTGSPVISGLASALRGAEYLIDTPEMRWSQRRIYDRPFPDYRTEIRRGCPNGDGRKIPAGPLAGSLFEPTEQRSGL